MSKRLLHFGPMAAAPVSARPLSPRAASAIRSAKPTLPAHTATVQRARAKPPALLAQRARELVASNVQTCVHCQVFLRAKSLQDTASIKVMTSIFKSSIYLLRREHRVTDGLDVAVAHLHESVAIAEKLAIPGTTHVVMHVTQKVIKKGNPNDAYTGYEHFHSFIVFDPGVKKLEAQYQDATNAPWAKAKGVATGLWGDRISEVKYAPDKYHLAIMKEYESQQVPHPEGLYPVYFSVEFKDGKAVIARWAF